MNVVFLTLTAISVSVDSFFAGLALSIKNQRKIPSVFSVLIAVFILCSLGALLGKIFGDFLKNYAQTLSGIILIAVGAIGLFKKNTQNLNTKSTCLTKKSLIVGASVGLDGAVGSFTLVASGFNGLFVTVFITLIHVVLLILAFLLGGKISTKIKSEGKLPSLMLILLGIYKLIT